jgi:hypothetical protein
MHAFYPLSFGHIFNLIFVLVLLGFLWLTFMKSKVSALIVLVLYPLIVVLMHFISQSDNKYSDVNHGLFGRWNVPIFGACLSVAFALQLYVLITKNKKSSTRKPETTLTKTMIN